ncbi:MAG: hypothetical protein ABIN18_27430 [Pseudomonadota bacterium]
MKKFLLLLYALILVLCSFGVASGTTYNIKARQPCLFPLLDHGYYHTWGIGWANNSAAQDGLFNPWQHVLNVADINFEFDSNEVTAQGKDVVDGKTLSTKAAPDSESAMFFLLASGLIGLTVFGRNFRRS